MFSKKKQKKKKRKKKKKERRVQGMIKCLQKDSVQEIINKVHIFLLV